MFDAYIRSVTENGKLIFPEDFCFNHDNKADHDKKALDEIEAQLGPYLYASNYYNNPVTDDLVEFKKEWFHTFQITGDLAKELQSSTCLISIDPATKAKENHDPTGMVISKIDKNGYVYILEAYAKRMRPNELIEEVFRLNNIYQPDRILIETVSAQALWLPLFEGEMRRRGIQLRLEGYDQGTSQSKPMKIRKLIPYYARGQVLHKRGLNELEQQLNEFPRNRHDDIIDALQAQAPYWTGRTVVRPKSLQKYTKAWWDELRRSSTKPSGTATERLFDDLKPRRDVIIKQPKW